MHFLGVIPARGGSRRLPGKNLLPINGKPLIAWTIEAAKKSKLDSFIVSTDSPEIAHVAIKYGAWVPFMRPAELATDEAKTVDVLRHAVSKLNESFGILPDYVVTLQPTTPTRTERDIDVAVDFLNDAPMSSFITTREDLLTPNGNVYATCYDMLMNDHLIWTTIGAVWPQIDKYYPDIDTEEDFKYAEKLLCGRS
jgi:CMP-N-acetylneuraminic acid synthetase